MVEKPYDWRNGATLEEHSRHKHKVLEKYLVRYLAVRCSHPSQERFRLAIIDGFAGGGRYKCNADGSPLIFIKTLKRAVEEINIERTLKGMREIEIDCLLIFNDISHEVINILKENVAPPHIEIKETCKKLYLDVQYFTGRFEDIYKNIKEKLYNGKYLNVIFNLDPCGHSHVTVNTIRDIMTSYRHPEIFYTFAIASFVTYLQRDNPEKLNEQLKPLGLVAEDILAFDDSLDKTAWLAVVERIVFNNFCNLAAYVSPFAINNSGGWYYWLMHFAQSYRARQEYNDILHQCATLQAHSGRAGLNIFEYKTGEGMLYQFDKNGRIFAQKQLMIDIPKFIMDKCGGNVSAGKFYEGIYNDTASHKDDIHSVVIENPDMEVITPQGGKRQKASTIDVKDTIRVKDRQHFFFFER